MFGLNRIYSRILGIGEVQRQSIASFVSQIAFTFIGFLSTIYFAHTVGASVLGAYFLFTAYYGIINMATDGGFGGAAIKRISEGEEQDAFFSAFFVLRSLFVFVVIIALIILNKYFVDINYAGLFTWLLVALVISLLYGTVSSGIAGCGKMGIYSAGNFINNLSRVIVQVVAIFFGYGVAGLAGGFVAGMMIAAVLELRFFDLRFVRFRWEHVKSLSTFSFWLFLTSGGILLYSYADTVMIGYYLSNTDIGVYRVVFQFTTLSLIATTAIRATLWPKVSRWGKIGEVGLIEESLSRAISYSLILPVPVFIGGILLGDKLLYFFYGAEFTRGYLTLVILLFVQIVTVFQIFILMNLSALDRQKDSFKVTAIGATANIVLNLLLIPLVGIVGAAIATLVTMTLNVVMGRIILSQIINIRVEYIGVLNILKASAVMALLVGGYRLFIPLSNLWLTLTPIAIGGIVYGVLLLKLDKAICYELKAIVTHMNIPWPNWL